MTEEQARQLELKLQSIEQSVSLWLAGDPHSRAIHVASKELSKMIESQLKPAKRSLMDAAAACNRLARNWTYQGQIDRAVAADACRDAILSIAPSVTMHEETPDIDGALMSIARHTDLWLAGPSQSGPILQQVKHLREWLAFQGSPIMSDPTRRALVKATHVCNDLAVAYNLTANSEKSMAAWECCTTVTVMAEDHMEILCDQF